MSSGSSCAKRTRIRQRHRNRGLTFCIVDLILHRHVEEVQASVHAMRGWRNRQTRTFEGRVGDRTGSSPVLRTKKAPKVRCFFCFMTSFVTSPHIFKKKNGHLYTVFFLFLRKCMEVNLFKHLRSIMPHHLCDIPQRYALQHGL